MLLASWSPSFGGTPAENFLQILVAAEGSVKRQKSL
jgi:hypothetical protein